MRKLIILAFVFATVLSTSCSKDEIDDFITPEDISGTTWKCTSGEAFGEDLEYALLVFTSTTAVEGWTKYIVDDVQKDWTGTFTISDDRISVLSENVRFTGVIEGEIINISMGEEVFVFSKQ